MDQIVLNTKYKLYKVNNKWCLPLNQRMVVCNPNGNKKKAIVNNNKYMIPIEIGDYVISGYPLMRIMKIDNINTTKVEAYLTVVDYLFDIEQAEHHGKLFLQRALVALSKGEKYYRK